MHLIIEGAKARAQTLAVFVGSIWLVSMAGFVFSPLKHVLGIEPRALFGLPGILTAPWAHAGLGHLLSNTVPLLVLGWMAMLPRQEGFWQAILGGALGAGAGAWLLGGAHTTHLGASGLVFGLFGFILALGYYTRRLVDIAVAAPVAAVYGLSMLLGVFPVYPGVSWQSHLGGVIGGVLAARYFAKDAL